MTGRQVTPASPPRRIINWEIPLWQLVTGFLTFVCVAFGFGLSFYNQAQQSFLLTQDLSKKLIDLTNEIKSGSQQGYSLSSSIALITFRVETLESDVRSLKNSPPVIVRRP